MQAEMKVLIGCEESQEVCIAFRERGHEAYSCDLQECSGGHPEWHIKADIRTLLKDYFDLVIFHPTCTRIANSGVMWLEKRNLWNDLDEACEFFNLRHKFNAPMVATENPIPHKYAIQKIGMYDEIIQPYMFGHLERKATCLWLKNLPELLATKNVYDEMKNLPKNISQRIHYIGPGPDRAKLRSKTFPGIAKAMADQWGG
jgi:hypothetical protein